MDDSSTAATLIGYLFGFAIAGAVAFWVATDANKRGMNGVGWGIGVFLLCIVFLPIYLIVRKPLLIQPQPYGYPPNPIAPPPPQSYAPPSPPQPYVTQPPPVHSQAPSQARHAFCSNCGAQLAADAKFCPSCGRQT